MNETVAVVGAGTIGRGVAQTLVNGGHPVVLVDAVEGQLASAHAQIKRDQRLLALYRRDQAAADPAETERLLTLSSSLEAAEVADFVVENVTEDFEVKRAVYEQLDGICRSDVIFAANTSALSITRLASVTGRADRVLGVHFMNPVPLIDTVEVIRGFHTSDTTLAASTDLLKRMGKQAIVVADVPGFVTNRVLMLTINEAAYCVQDQVCSASDVDRMFKGCFGHPMGPLETADLIGLDTILNSILVLHDSFNDSKYRPAYILKRMVAAGLLGRKSGRGFYEYASHAKGRTDG